MRFSICKIPFNLSKIPFIHPSMQALAAVLVALLGAVAMLGAHSLQRVPRRPISGRGSGESGRADAAHCTWPAGIPWHQ